MGTDGQERAIATATGHLGPRACFGPSGSADEGGLARLAHHRTAGGLPLAHAAADVHRVEAVPVQPGGDPLYVACRGGGRSARVAMWLNANGYDAVNVAGGMGEWEAAGRPMVSETGQQPFVR